MATTKRIYSVMDSEAGKTLVLAFNASQAIRHVVSNRYSATPAKAVEVAAFFQDGGKVIEEAGVDKDEDIVLTNEKNLETQP